MKDPETGNYVKGDYMTQLSVLSTFSVDTSYAIKQANKGSIEAYWLLLVGFIIMPAMVILSPQ